MSTLRQLIEVQSREGRVLDQVVASEDAQVADRLVDLVAAVRPREESPQPLGRHVLGDRVEVGPGAGLVERALGDVRREHLEGEGLDSSAAASSRQIAIEYASSPVAQPGTQTRTADFVPRSFRRARQDVLAESLEHLRVAKEGGDGDQAVLVRGPAPPPGGPRGAGRTRRCPSMFARAIRRSDPALDRRLLVGSEVGARVLPDDREHPAEPARPVRAAGAASERRAAGRARLPPPRRDGVPAARARARSPAASRTRSTHPEAIALRGMPS